jgi:hypothetical protein
LYKARKSITEQNSKQYRNKENNKVANVSTAYGTIELVGEWTDELIAALNRYTQNWARWTYGITPDEDFSQESNSVIFTGSGKWTLESTLEGIGASSALENEHTENQDLRDDYAILIREMEKRNLGLALSFDDEECGNGVLYTQQGLITVQNGQFTYKITDNMNYEYTWANLIRVTNDACLFYDLVDQLCEEVGDDRRAEVEKWAMTTYPHTGGIDDLSEEERADFTAKFGLTSTIN